MGETNRLCAVGKLPQSQRCWPCPVRFETQQRTTSVSISQIKLCKGKRRRVSPVLWNGFSNQTDGVLYQLCKRNSTDRGLTTVALKPQPKPHGD